MPRDDDVQGRLARHVLTDGFQIILDLPNSCGSWIVDAETGERYLDLYSFFASAPLGINPPGVTGDPELMALLAGAISDNWDRRMILLIAQGFMFSVSTLLAVTAWFGLIGPWQLLTFTFLIGCGTALNNPAWQSSVGDMVPRQDIPAATMLNSAGFNFARSVGPAIGGVIVASAGAAVAFVINAASYVALIAVLARWHPSRPERLLPRVEPCSALRLRSPPPRRRPSPQGRPRSRQPPPELPQP